MNQYGDSNPYYGNGGGGYLTGGSPFGAAGGSPGGSVRRPGSLSLRPVTIKQLNSATQAHSDAEWVLDGTEIGPITLVAQVLSIKSQTTNNVYWLDDGTGRTEARHWTDASSGEDGENFAGITDGIYIRVTGSIKSFGNKRYINATHLRRLKDSLETYFHTLEVFTVTTIMQRGPPPRPGEVLQRGTTMAGGSSAYTAQPQYSNDQHAHLPPLARNILSAIRELAVQDENGAFVGKIAAKVGGDANEINTALDKLMDEGLVYSTISESWFKLSD